MKPRHTDRVTASRPRRGGADETRDQIIDWLRDAYAMERGLERSLKKQAENEDLSPEIRNRAGRHLEETRQHAIYVQEALRALGSDTSAIKTGVGIATQAVKGMGTLFASDERIKDLLDAYAMEHFEIACYTGLISAAERAGLADLAQTCHRIIEDEERMAQSLLDSLPDEILGFLYETERKSEET